ncbi:hypothetical protein MAPG_04682 [Magnaporthiopsis poae ATCC 64411]|uniref:Kinesin motor domain-containing protein n=1 Tax=Magnaporthiopsis poae (strain ATCC 64411 / 73-15) TaxID=644358 RepID=A0A0C4DXD7_MAGP6|nr:hypothetical protein MAPG_04682 [Magnaporthiopsis poae ATCC 64411]
MEEFLEANLDRFQALTEGFKPKDEGLASKKSNSRTTATDIVVVARQLVLWACSGGVGTLFAHGQTSSGKAFTVSGLERVVASSLFGGGSGSAYEERRIFVRSSSWPATTLLTDSFGETQVAGSLEMQAMPSGGAYMIAPSEDGLLYLVDLAGSEAAREINASLSALKDCICGKALHDATTIDGGGGGWKAMLWHVFDPDSGRSCRTVVVACVNPGAADTAASNNTLKYAEMLKIGVPSSVPRPYDPRVPATWSNVQLREWFLSSSGSPAVDAENLAPSQTGPQLLRLPIPEFLRRCLLTPGVRMDQARAFQSKFWQLHVDSWRAPASQQQSQPSTSAETEVTSGDTSGYSSRAIRLPGSLALPFQERIRPGMVVRWGPDEYSRLCSQHYIPRQQNLAMVLCPQFELVPGVQDASGNEVLPAAGGAGAAGASGGKSRDYLCALVLPGMMSGAFEVRIWQQVVVPVEWMEEEVILEYGHATRYFYMSA